MSQERALTQTIRFPEEDRLTRLAGELSALAAEFAACEASIADDLAVSCSSQEYAQRVRKYLAARDARSSVMPGDWFADPAWDLLLDLFASHHEGKSVSISSACIAARVPPTTALRWIDRLTECGALVRRADPADRRRAHLTLSPELLSRIARWVTAYLTGPLPRTPLRLGI